MQKRAFCLLLSLFGQSCVLSPIGLAHAEASVESSGSLPVRRSGLWRISTLSAAVGLQVSEACIGPKDSIIGDDTIGCLKPEITRAGEQTVVTVVCASDGRRVISSLLFTGDFTTWYRAQGKITSESADRNAQAHSGFTIEAKFLQPDCIESPSQK